MPSTGRGRWRRAARIVAALGALTGGSASAQMNDFRIESGTDRRGADLAVDIAASPEACAERCRNDRRCVAFTFVLPNTIQGPEGRCWLKFAVPPSSASGCCVSGVKTIVGDELVPEGPGVVGEP